jgi:hypothetical protein
MQTMNNPHEPLDESHHELPPNDPLLDQAFSCLQRLQPPLESQARNRAAVSQELGHLWTAKQKRWLPWWRRTIAVPVPLAVGLAALIAILFFAGYRYGSQTVSPQHLQHANGMNGTNQAAAHPELEYYETETYLCGIGRLRSTSGYSIREENQ